MTPGDGNWVIALASVSAGCELIGTLTVLRSFCRTSKTAREIKEALKPSPGKQYSGETYAQFMEHGDLLRSIADKIGWDWWTFAGLLAYVLGACAGLWAAILAVRS